MEQLNLQIHESWIEEYGTVHGALLATGAMTDSDKFEYAHLYHPDDDGMCEVVVFLKADAAA